MSTDTPHVIQRAITAFEREDADAFAACFDPEGEFRLPRNQLEGGSYRGRDGVTKALADAYETWRGFRIEVHDVEPESGGFVVQARVTNLPRRGGPDVEYRAAYAVRVSDDLITYWSSCETAEAARSDLDAVS